MNVDSINDPNNELNSQINIVLKGITKLMFDRFAAVTLN